MTRRGYSLIELVVAMIAATALVSSLAATIVITTELLEVPPDNQAAWHDRDIADRLAADLRYASRIDESSTSGFTITRPDPASGTAQDVTYECYLDGLTRRVDSGPVIAYDSQAPGHVFQVDGYSAPTAGPATNEYVRLRSTSTARSSVSVSSLDIDIPPGCKTGDLLLLCLSARTPNSVAISGSGWQTLSIQGIDNLRLVVAYRRFDASLSDQITVTVAPSSAIAAAMVALEHADPAQPIDWNSGDSGYALSWYPPSHPTPLEGNGFLAGQLNVQIVAAEGDPWNEGSLGLASFTDAVRATAASGYASLENSVGIAIRSGPTATMSTTPRVWHQSSGFWVQCGLRVEVNR
jgi:hypothetical protein